ncbi:uncharacterized protein LOC117337160 [Pecten maximus]|uniref:uncharacterized protein LOC117337160 n=1 Tax=Pecten maximus TaxID=6579 RepID=UPI0014583E2C|nr:uncharacterized protein LOC117337160 [Pecten maximus]
MGKTFKQRLQSLFSSSSNTPRPEPVAFSTVSSSPPYYNNSCLPYISADLAGSIQAISGIDLATVSHVTRSKDTFVPITLPDPPKKISMIRRLCCRPTPEPKPVAVDDVIVRGTICQDSVGPLFVNRQCTTMAYEALAYQALRSHPETWTSKDIDTIIRLGHRQHARFRITDKLSAQIDGKVGLYQLPDKYRVRMIPEFVSNETDDRYLKGQDITARYLSCVDGCFQYHESEIAEALSEVSPEFPTFMTKTFEPNRQEDVNMVLTIGVLSVAVWRRKDDSRLWLFDSHRRSPKGDCHYAPTVSEQSDPGAAILRSFENLDALVAHLIKQHGTDFQYSAAMFGYDVK